MTTVFNPFTKRLDYAATSEITSYVHDQSVASATWVVTHNQNYFPSVTVVDSAETQVIFGNVTYNTSNQLTITFAGGFAGKAYLN